MRELTHTALSDVAGDWYLCDVSVRGDKIVVCGADGAAIYKLIYRYTNRYMYMNYKIIQQSVEV